MDENRRFMAQICNLWTKFALEHEKRMEKKYQPLFLNNSKQYKEYQHIVKVDEYTIPQTMAGC